MADEKENFKFGLQKILILNEYNNNHTARDWSMIQLPAKIDKQI
jgi:hypothetical protein